MARLALALALLAGLEAWADSPLTSIDFTPAYSDLSAIREAKNEPQITPVVMELLLSGSANDKKAAAINALGWEAIDNASAFLGELARQRRLDPDTLELKSLSPSEVFVVGYLRAMEDYLELKALRPGHKGVWGKKPLELLDYAAKALPDDFTVQYVRAIVRAQKTMEKAELWCEVFKGPQRVLEQFPAEKRNLRPGAVEAAVGYLGMYEESCPTSKVANFKKREELNQIYALARLGNQLVAGTQAGVVIWDPASKQPVAIQDEFICGHVVIWQDAAWAGCDQHVVRWDGKSFKSYLNNAAKDADYYAPMLGPGGKLWVRYGSKTYAYDPASDGFAVVQTPWKAAPYDAHVTADGELWWIDFLNSIHSTRRAWPIKSTDYPGSDPRRFDEAADGALWVEDFESGLFRLSAGARFFAQPGLSDQASGVAFDAARERLFLLHYRHGLTIQQAGKPPQSVEVPELEYIRALLLDRNSDVWLGGWTQLLRLRERDGVWTRESYRIEPLPPKR